MFFEVLVPALIGAMLAPSFSQFLNINLNKKEKRLKYLEEAYLLTRRVNEYGSQIPAHITMLIAYSSKSVSSVPKISNDPFPELLIILDYHLNTPEELIAKIKSLNIKILSSFRPVAESINNPREKDKFYLQAIEQATDAATDSQLLSNEIITWIKNEKTQIDNTPSVFDKSYWIISWRNVSAFIKQFR